MTHDVLEQKALVVVSIGSTFIGAIIFLAAFLIVLPIRRKVRLIAALVASSFLLGTFVIFNPVLSRRVISSLLFQSRNGFQNSDGITFESFGQQVIAGLFRDPDRVAQTIVIGSFVFGFSAAIWGFLFWRAARRSENAAISAIENAKKTAQDSERPLR